MLSEGTPQRSRQHRDADDPESPQPRQEAIGNGAVDHGALESQAVDQHRRLQRLEIGHAELVERADSDLRQVDLSGPEVGEHGAVVVDHVPAPAAAVVDSHAAGREAADRVDVLLRIRPSAVRIGEREHDGLDAGVAAGLVLAGAAAHRERCQNAEDHDRRGLPRERPHGGDYRPRRSAVTWGRPWSRSRACPDLPAPRALYLRSRSLLRRRSHAEEQIRHRRGAGRSRRRRSDGGHRRVRDRTWKERTDRVPALP